MPTWTATWHFLICWMHLPLSPLYYIWPGPRIALQTISLLSQRDVSVGLTSQFVSRVTTMMVLIHQKILYLEALDLNGGILVNAILASSLKIYIRLNLKIWRLLLIFKYSWECFQRKKTLPKKLITSKFKILKEKVSKNATLDVIFCITKSVNKTYLFIE